jgi:hypothetical protein
MGLVVAYNSGLPPSTMGHTWGEMECSGCITTSNLADSSVTTAKLADSSVTTAKIADGTIMTADVSSIDGSKITGTVPNADMVDGYHATQLIDSIACSWNGWVSAYGGVSCGGNPCDGYAAVLQFYCSGGKVTQAQTASVCIHCWVY